MKKQIAGIDPSNHKTQENVGLVMKTITEVLENNKQLLYAGVTMEEIIVGMKLLTDHTNARYQEYLTKPVGRAN